MTSAPLIVEHLTATPSADGGTWAVTDSNGHPVGTVAYDTDGYTVHPHDWPNYVGIGTAKTVRAAVQRLLSHRTPTAPTTAAEASRLLRRIAGDLGRHPQTSADGDKLSSRIKVDSRNSQELAKILRRCELIANVELLQDRALVTWKTPSDTATQRG